MAAATRTYDDTAFRYSDLDSNATDTRVALLTASMKLEGIRKLGLHGIRPLDIARVVLALGVQPHQAIAKGLIKPGLFHGVSWTLLDAPLGNTNTNQQGAATAVVAAPAPAPPSGFVAPSVATKAAPVAAAVAAATRPGPSTTTPVTPATPATATPSPSSPSSPSAVVAALHMSDAELAAAFQAEEDARTLQRARSGEAHRERLRNNARRARVHAGAVAPATTEPQWADEATSDFPPLPAVAETPVEVESQLSNNVSLLQAMGLVWDVPTETRARELLMQYDHNVDKVASILSVQGFTQRSKKKSRSRNRARNRRRMTERRAAAARQSRTGFTSLL